MPQKRNPVALEHARAIASTAVGQANAILLAVHNTPFGDIVDTEDDLQPLVHAMFTDASRAALLVAAAMATARFDAGRLAERARQGWITVTELADTLTRDHDVPFRTSHTIASRFVSEASRRPGEPPARILRDITESVLGRAIAFTDAALADLLSPEHFVRVRTTPGGPAPTPPAQVASPSIPGITLYQPPQAQPPAAQPPAGLPPAAAPPVVQAPPKAAPPASGRVALGNRPPPSESDDDPPPAAAGGLARLRGQRPGRSQPRALHPRIDVFRVGVAHAEVPLKAGHHLGRGDRLGRRWRLEILAPRGEDRIQRRLDQLEALRIHELRPPVTCVVISE